MADKGFLENRAEKITVRLFRFVLHVLRSFFRSMPIPHRVGFKITTSDFPSALRGRDDYVCGTRREFIT